jgi:hypothetical protein
VARSRYDPDNEVAFAMSITSRRRFLSTTALAGLGTGLSAVLGGRAAHALTYQPMTAPTHQAYISGGCSTNPDPYHQKLLADARAELAATLKPAEIDAQLAQLTCPICGCSLALAAPGTSASAPHG